MKTIVIPFSLIVSLAVSAQEPVKPQPHVKKGFGVSMEQVQPEFPGGSDSLNSFLMHNMTYPEMAKQNKEQGTVYVAFYVDVDGKIKDEQVLKSISANLDNEALRVVKMMPDWKPGTAGGQARKMQYILPFDFRLPENIK